MSCKVCTHYKRAEIENALLSMSTDKIDEELATIAVEYSVEINELKIHALMHTPINITANNDSIARQLKLKEANVLSAVINEYLVTLKSVGRQINAWAVGGNFERMINKPVVELYLGTGGEIRATVRTLAELNSLLNGPDTGNASGLHALAAAIINSKNPTA